MRAPPEALFEYIPDEPVAAASLAQVYRARVKGGLEVAVKLQRPGLAESVALDATILRWGDTQVDRGFFAVDPARAFDA